MAQGLGLAWRDRHVDRTGFPGDRNGVVNNDNVIVAAAFPVGVRQVVHGHDDGLVDCGHVAVARARGDVGTGVEKTIVFGRENERKKNRVR